MPRITVCDTCNGNGPLLADLEDLAEHFGVKIKLGECLSRCSSGPNCVVHPDRQTGKQRDGKSERASKRDRSHENGKERRRRRDEKSDDDEDRGKKKHGKEHKRRNEDDSDDNSRRRRREEDVDSQENKRKRDKGRRRDDSDDELPSTSRGKCIVSRNTTFEKSLKLLRHALGGLEPELPKDVLRRAQLRSDALRFMCHSKADKLLQADILLTEAIELELTELSTSRTQPPANFRGNYPVSRIVELRTLRGELRGVAELRRFDDAILDLEAALNDEPALTSAWVEKAKIYRRMQRHNDAFRCLQKAQELGKSQPPPPEGLGLSKHILLWVDRMLSQLEQRLLEVNVAQGGDCFGFADANDSTAADSGNGAGWWKVKKIEGLSWDTCVYHFTNHPPANPHPYPHDLWHVRACIGSTWREYTPISTAFDWEKGSLSLLVKTYENGTVSKQFATLQPAGFYADVEEQRCWLLLSTPMATLRLASVQVNYQESTQQTEETTTKPIEHIGLVVGGTGVAPALQLLREVVDADGAFGQFCRATLLYSSRSPSEVLLINELRDVVAQSNGRIVIRHTLTDFDEQLDTVEDLSPGESMTSPASGGLKIGSSASNVKSKSLPSFPNRHYYFASEYNTFKPKEGPLRTGPCDEGSLRGRVDAAMCATVLPSPGPSVKVIVCGPPRMWDDVSDLLQAAGHNLQNLIELKA